MFPAWDAVPSIATLAVMVWAGRVLIPRAVKERDPLALGAAILTVALAVLLWFLAGYVRVSS